MATLASLVVEIAANTAKFQQGMQQAVGTAQRSAAQINNSLTSIQAGFTKAVTAARTLAGAFGVGLGAAAFVGLIRDSMRLGGELNTVSERVGVSIERLQELGYAATQTGASFEELEQGLGVLNQRIGEARAGNVEALKFFQKIGIQAQVLSGEISDAGGALGPFADKIKNTASAGDQMALAQEGMSRSARALLPMLREGSEGLTRLGADARKAGIVMSEDMARGLSKANDQFDAMARVIRVQLAAAILELKDPLLAVVGWAAQAAKGVRQLAEQADRISGRFKQMFAPDEAANLEELNGRINQNATLIADLVDKRAALVESMKTVGPFGQQTAREQIEQLDKERAILEGRRHVLTALAAKAAVPTEMTLRRPGPPAGPAPISKEQLDAMAAFRQQLIDMATQDPTLKALANIGEQADKLKEKFPRAASEIDLLASAMRNTAVQASVLSKEAERSEKETKALADSLRETIEGGQGAEATVAGLSEDIFDLGLNLGRTRLETVNEAAGLERLIESLRETVETGQGAEATTANLSDTTQQTASAILAMEKALTDLAEEQAVFGDSFTENARKLEIFRATMQRLRAEGRAFSDEMTEVKRKLSEAIVGAEIERLDAALRGINAQARVMGNSAAVMGDGFDQVKAAAEATRRSIIALMSLPEQTSETEQAIAGLTLRLNELNAVALAQTGIRDIFGALNQAVNQSIAGVIQGTLTLEEAFKNMGQSIALSLIQNIINRGINVVMEAVIAMVAKLAGAGVYGLGYGAGVQAAGAPIMVGPGFLDAAEGAYVKHSPGGSLMRVGEGGKDEAIFPLDRIPVNPGSGGGKTSIVINNNAGAQVGASEKQTPDGRQIEVMIDRVVTDGFSSGRYGGVMSSTYGLNRKGRVS